MMSRTRIKLCGLSRSEDVVSAIAAGADAIGLVFYPPSPRYVAPAQAAALLRELPPFVTSVGLFVNATLEEIRQVLATAPVGMLQFHGDETASECAAIAEGVKKPFLRALRVQPAMNGADLLKYEQEYRAASTWFSGLLLDTWVDAYGGSGKVFDWSLIPKELAPRVVLSGGLSVHNTTDAVALVHPYAVDVSSGIESAKGIKDSASMHAFVEAVRRADEAAARLT